MHDKVTRLRQILSEAIPRKPAQPQSEVEALRAFQYYESSQPTAPTLDQSPKARAIREITRIASWYQWGHVVEMALDDAQASSLASLDDITIEELRVTLKRLEDCVHTGGDSPYSPPAR